MKVDDLNIEPRSAPLNWMKPFYEAWSDDWRMAIAVGETPEEAVGKWYFNYGDSE